MLIDIFHDTVCPWCHIGKKHLFDALSQWSNKTVKVRWHPYLLDSKVPPEGLELRSFMQKRKGISNPELQRLFDYTKTAGEAAGVKLDFANIPLAVNTTLSHQLIALAPDDCKNDVVEAIYKAYFVNGLNLGNINVIVSLGADAGMNATQLHQQLSSNAALDTVLAESAFARLNGITSVPFFIINNQIKVDGYHSVKVFQQALNQAALMAVSAKQ